MRRARTPRGSSPSQTFRYFSTVTRFFRRPRCRKKGDKYKGQRKRREKKIYKSLAFRDNATPSKRVLASMAFRYGTPLKFITEFCSRADICSVTKAPVGIILKPGAKEMNVKEIHSKENYSGVWSMHRPPFTYKALIFKLSRDFCWIRL